MRRKIFKKFKTTKQSNLDAKVKKYKYFYQGILYNIFFIKIVDISIFIDYYKGSF